MPPFLSLLVLDERLRASRFTLALILFALIVLAGSIPGARAELGNMASGLVLHSVAYGGLTLLLFTGTRGTRSERALKAVLTAMAMGAADELVQSMLPYRAGTLLDWMVDATSALVVAALLRAFLPDPVHRHHA